MIRLVSLPASLLLVLVSAVATPRIPNVSQEATSTWWNTP